MKSREDYGVFIFMVEEKDSWRFNFIFNMIFRKREGKMSQNIYSYNIYHIVIFLV